MADEEFTNLTPLQTNALQELKSRISEYAPGETKFDDDITLYYRFLKARDFDVGRAEIMLKKYLQWRRQNSNIQNYKPPEVLKKYLSNLHIGYDKEGCPVFYVAGGKYDTKGIHLSAKYSDIEKSLVQIIIAHENHLEKKCTKGKRRITKFIIILNETDLTFANTINKNGMESLIRIAQLQQNIFPERMKAIFFINVPSYFTVGYNIVKNFLSSETLKKIHVYGTEGWQEELLKLIDPDQLPKFMGGTRTDPDGNPLCKTILNQGGIIHESYYIHKSKHPLAKYPGVKKLHVSRSSSAKIPFEVPEAGSVIEWEFETKSGDIVFGINYSGTENEDDQMMEALPFQRLSTKDFAEIGMYKCEKPGNYVVLFDNSYSWFRSKEIYYRIKVVRGNELEDQFNG